MECPCPGYVPSGLCPVRVMVRPGYVLSGLRPVRVVSCPGYVLSELWVSGLWTSGLWVSGLWESGLCPSTPPTSSYSSSFSSYSYSSRHYFQVLLFGYFSIIVYFWNAQHSLSLSYFEGLSGGWINKNYRSPNLTLNIV